MKILLVALVALVAAVVAGHYVAEDPGFVVIGYGGKVVRTTFAFFLVLGLVGFLAAHGLINLLARLGRMRTRWRHWTDDHRRRRAHSSLADGLLAMAAGDFARAEKLFRGGVEDDSQPEAHFLAAAAAAQAAGAPARRDNYLALAASARPDARNAFHLQRAGWLLDNGQVSEARPLIERLAAAEPHNPEVLRLRMELARTTFDHEALMALVPALRRDRVINHDAINALERETAVALLSRADLGREALDARWNALAKNLRAHAEVLSAYVRGLCRHHADDRAEELVRKRIERQWDTALAALYGEIACEPPAKQLRKLEAWSVTRPDDPGLRLARVRQAIRAGLWGQAREQLDHLLLRAPSPLLLELKAEVAEGMGDEANAARHRKAGLDLALGRVAAHVALPAPPAAGAND
jgi:HemY protein